jgi:hypothetical protein
MHVHTSDRERLSLGFGGYTCNWGVHMCGLYETDAERDDLVYNFLHEGDLNEDVVRYYHSAPTSDGFLREYARRFPGEAEHPNSGDRFTVISAEQRNYPNGRFDPLSQDPKLKAVRDRAVTEGCRIRGVGEMNWAAEGVPGCELLLPYEARINGLFEKAPPMVIICIYDVRRFNGSIIMGVLRTHRFAIIGGIIVENPYYDPQKVLDEHGVSWPPLS